jgi:hypothetical protein
MVCEWAESTFPGATIVNLREDWNARKYDDSTLVVPVRLETDSLGLGHIVVDLPATIGALRQLCYLASDGIGPFEDFIARSLCATDRAVAP